MGRVVPPDNERCTATAKNSGERCKEKRINGTTKCKYHGGASLRGRDHPNWKHGRYAKSVDGKVRMDYEQALSNKRLLELNDDIALIEARIMQLLGRVGSQETGAMWRLMLEKVAELDYAIETGNPGTMLAALHGLKQTIQRGYQDFMNWHEITEAIERKRRLVESERKQQSALENYVPVDQVLQFAERVIISIVENVSNKQEVQRVRNDIAGMLGTGNTADDPEDDFIEAEFED